ncbi:hypothetical protein EV363DRAFT_1346999 [Boletus edulis]|nr:hypothetical protein EV363DRAFT_1346999 [Boletus edulis]
MVRGIPDHSEAAAKVSHDARPCTAHTDAYSYSLEAGVRCRLWDTPGLDHLAASHYVARLVDRIRRQPASQQARPTEGPKPIILVWCIDAMEFDILVSWHQFRTVYAIVLTRMPAVATARWEGWWRYQLQQLGLPNIPLLRVRIHRGRSSPEYMEDSKALRHLISQLARDSMTVPDIHQVTRAQGSSRQHPGSGPVQRRGNPIMAQRGRGARAGTSPSVESRPAMSPQGYTSDLVAVETMFDQLSLSSPPPPVALDTMLAQLSLSPTPTTPWPPSGTTSTRGRGRQRLGRSPRI